jgi:hypothetical protein
MMKTSVALLAVLSVAGLARVQLKEAAGSKTASATLQPSPEMQKLSDAFTGNWKVSEKFDVSSTLQGKNRQGTASFRLGPGVSLIEDYKSNGSAGDLNSVALFWWDESARAYRLFTCANNYGCQLRGNLTWEGDKLVNSWQEEVNGQMATFTDSFVDISPSAFLQISEGSAGGKTIWRVITRHTRLNGEEH